jgi:hypothetical protein
LKYATREIYGSGRTCGTCSPPKAAGKLGAIVQGAKADGPPVPGIGLAFEFGSGFGLMLSLLAGGTIEESGNMPLSEGGGLDAGARVT